MLSDLLIGPSPTCQHGNRKLHRRQLPRNLSPVFRIMKRHPAPAERNHTLRDPLIRLRIPVPDTGLDQPPLSRRHIPQRQIRIPIQNTRRKLQLNNPAGQIPPRDLTTLLRLPRKIKKLSPRNIPQIHIHKPLNNLPSPPRLKRRIQKRQNHIITHTTHSPPKPRQPPKDHPQNQTNKPPKLISQATSTHIRSPSHTPHQHTSEALLSSHISIHPKLFSQATSAHIRSSSLNPHQHTSEALLSSHTSAHIRSSSLKSHISTHPKLFSQASSAYIRSSSLKPHQHTSEALLSSPTKQSPKLRISINQSISQSVNQSDQPSFSIIIIQNTPKINLNITQKHLTLSKTASIPNPLTTNRKKLTPPTSNAAPIAHTLPAHQHTTTPHTPKKQNGQTASGAAAWSGPGASE